MTHTSSDAQLIGAARAGDEAAYEELYRHHSDPALRFARSLTASMDDAQDAVAEAFARVLVTLRAGGGPEEAFRPYLLTAVRNILYNITRPSRREWTVGDVGPYQRAVPSVDPVLASEERRLIAAAFDELPERWQMVLWHTAVEGERPATVAPLLGISTNAVAALAYRAREGLRERYLHAHLATTTDQTCRSIVDRLAAYTRKRLSRSEASQIHAHLKDCAACAVLFGELSDVNARLGALVGPVVLGAGAATYLSAATAGGGAGAAAAIGHVLQHLVQRWELQVGAGAVSAAGAVGLVLLTGMSGPTTHQSSIPVAAALPSASAVAPRSSVPPSSASPAAEGNHTRADADPAGNNGTVKIGDGSIDSRANVSHVPCDFDLSFYNFDAGQTAMITFTINAPSGYDTVLHRASQIISTGPASGGQTQDAVVHFSGSDWDLGRFDHHLNQGYRVRLDVESAGLAGGRKHKTFWLDCPPPEEASGTPAPPEGASGPPAPQLDGRAAASPSQETHRCHLHKGPCQADPLPIYSH